MASDRYQELRSRIDKMREHLLSAVEISETGSYEDADKVAILSLSFRVLAHAEIESYLEDRVVGIAKAALASWKSSNHISRPLLYLLAFSGNHMKKPPESLEAPSDNKRKEWPSLLDPSDRLNDAVTAFVRAAQLENHGVREANLLSLLLPVGLDPSLLDPVLLTDFDSFGRRRGEAAHKSTTTHVRKELNPADEEKYVDNLLVGILPLDEALDSLLEGASIGHDTATIVHDTQPDAEADGLMQKMMQMLRRKG